MTDQPEFSGSSSAPDDPSGAVPDITARKRAQEALPQQDRDLDELSPQDLRTLAETLRIHQVELEVQNEELIQARQQLEKISIQYADLFDFAPIGYFVLDKAGSIQEVNLTGASLLGMERRFLISKPLSVYVSQRSKEVFYQHLQKVVKTGIRQTCEVRLVKRNGEKFYARLESNVLQGNEASAIRMRTALIDITAHKQAEEALRQSEERSRLLIENVMDYAIFMLDPQGHIISWSAGAERIKGYRAEEIIGQHFSRFYPAEDVQRGKPEQELVMAKAEGRVEDEGWRVRKDGSRFWANVVITALYDQDRQLRGFAKVTRDYTERKQAEEKLRHSEQELAELQRRLIEGREAERLQMAQDIHDGPVQGLYGAIFILSDLAQAVTSEADQAHLADAQKLLQQVLRELRTMANQARPPTLAPFGLEKAIESHIDQFQQSYPELEVKLDLMPDGQTLPEQTRLALFRIYQAALTNVVRHAVARQVFIRFSLDKEQVMLAVQDDGQGFEVPERWIEIGRQGHLGLIGMMERAESIGGQLQVVSAPGQGTLIQVVVSRLPGPGHMTGIHGQSS